MASEKQEIENLQEEASPSEENLKENSLSSENENTQEEVSLENLEEKPSTESLADDLPQEEVPPSRENPMDSTCESNKETAASSEKKSADVKDQMLDGELLELDFEDFTNNVNSESVDKNNSKNDAVEEKDGAVEADKKPSDVEKEDGACSEGECNDLEDLEEGELQEPNSSMSDSQGPTRQVCRFFHRGQCFYQSSCRFLHLTNNQKGNYSMFETPQNTHRSGGFPNQPHNLGGQRQPPRVPQFVNTAPVPFSNEESAWEKGLREARNLLKQANLKRTDPNFAEKKLNISLCVNERNIPDVSEREKRIDFKKHDKERDNFYNYKGYDNYGDSHGYNDRREKDTRDNPPRPHQHFRKQSDDRRFSKGRKDIERPFYEDQSYFDPWRRSKSPNRLSRERSHSSFSSYSSPPYSRSSSESGSPAPSSRSSRSSRSPSVQQKRKVSPEPETAVSPKVSSNRFSSVKKKPGPRTSSYRSRSHSSRSRSVSMDLDSVSSASQSRNSSPSHSSSDSEHESKDDLRDKPVTNPDSASMDSKFRGVGSILNSKRDLLEEKFEDAPVEMDLRYLIPKVPEKKEPVRLALTHKNPIKLTLLNKFPQSKAGFSKDSKDFGAKKPDEPLKQNQGVKRPLSPSESAEPVKPTPALLPKKSASSRRDELLKQLKAVEDAIARKRAKF